MTAAVVNRLSNLLRKSNKRLYLAESCTGGSIASLITSVPGNSDIFIGSMVTYSNASKEDWLGIKPEHIELYGAVSEEIAKEMALSVVTNDRDHGKVCAIATTGYIDQGYAYAATFDGISVITEKYSCRVPAEYRAERQKEISILAIKQLIKQLEKIEL